MSKPIAVFFSCQTRPNLFDSPPEALLFKKLWEQTDEYLIKCCLNGDENAWAALVDRYKNLIFHFPHKERLAEEDCDEVFQETLLAMYNQLERIKNVSDLSFWISKVAQRNTWKVVNRNLKYMELSDTYDVEDPDLIPAAHLELSVQQFRIRQALGQLDEKCRKLLTMLFFEADANDYKRVSKELGIAMGSIGPTRNRCFVKFKKVLEKYGVNKENVSKWLT